MYKSYIITLLQHTVISVHEIVISELAISKQKTNIAQQN